MAMITSRRAQLMMALLSDLGTPTHASDTTTTALSVSCPSSSNGSDNGWSLVHVLPRDLISIIVDYTHGDPFVITTSYDRTARTLAFIKIHIPSGPPSSTPIASANATTINNNDGNDEDEQTVAGTAVRVSVPVASCMNHVIKEPGKAWQGGDVLITLNGYTYFCDGGTPYMARYHHHYDTGDVIDSSPYIQHSNTLAAFKDRHVQRSIVPRMYVPIPYGHIPYDTCFISLRLCYLSVELTSSMVHMVHV